MRIEDLSVFLDIAKYKSISEVARREHFSQPAISAILNSLEKSLGVKLVERHVRQRSPLKLTDEGEILLRYAEQIVSDYQNLTMDITYKNLTPTPFVIGCGRSFSALILPSLVSNFKSSYPAASLEMKTYSNTSMALDALKKRECDMTLSSVIDSTPGLQYERLMDDPFLLASPLEMELPTEIGIRQLKRLPFIMREENSFTYEQINAALKKRGVDISNLNVIMTVHDNSTVKQSIEMGNGCGFVPRSAVANSKMRHEDVRIINVKGLNINRSIYLVRREEDIINENLKLFWSYACTDKWYKELFAYDPISTVG